MCVFMVVMMFMLMLMMVFVMVFMFMMMVVFMMVVIDYFSIQTLFHFIPYYIHVATFDAAFFRDFKRECNSRKS